MKIVVIGSGYVGTTTSVLLANAGHKVVALDLNEERINSINSGKAPFYETGLDDLISEAITQGNLRATSSYEDALVDAEVIFSCVGTPDNPDGSSNLDYVFSATKSASKLMGDGVIYVQKSTVPVGTGKKLIETISSLTSISFSYLSNPEFLREGTAIKDSLLFDRVVIGGDDNMAQNKVAQLYKDIEENKVRIAKTAKLNLNEKRLNEHNGNYILTTINSAELIKVTANAFLALKISFANSIAKLADKTGADIVEVMDGVGADQRIGRAFLNAGRGYGGGCFPKDVSGLISSGSEHGVDLHIMTASNELNESMPGYIVNKVKLELGQLRGKRCSVLGLSFKAGTSDARKSPAVAIANRLAHDGAVVKTFDPKALDEAAEELRKDVKICKTAEESIENCEAVFIATDWPEFLDMNLNLLAKKMSGNLFVDCMNSFEKNDVESSSLTYIGVGR